MKRISTILRPAIVALAASVLGGCEHRELCYDHSHWTDFNIEFDWSKAPDANPRTMVVYLFSDDGSEPMRYELTDINGGTVRAIAGNYKALAFNGETQTIVESGNTWHDFVLTTAEEHLLASMSRDFSKEPPRAPIATDEAVHSAPDDIWVDALENITVAPARGRGQATSQTLRFTPVKATINYTVELTDIVNLTPDTELSVALTSMSENYSPSLGRHGGRNTTIPFGLRITGPNTATGTAAMFGHCPGSEMSHILTIYTSSMRYYHFDVTSQIHDAPDPTHITLQISNIILPDPEKPGGMTPSVSDWDEGEETDLDMD